MYHKLYKTGVLFVAAATIASACGGDSDDESTATTSGGGDTPATTAGGDTPATTAGGDTPATTAGGDTPATTGGGDAPATTAAPESADEIDTAAVLRYGQFRVDSLDPIRQGVPCETSVLYPLFDTLVTIDLDGAPQPMLAESWELLDGNVLQLKLREDVTFHDGTPLNAEAVVFNIDRVLNDPESNISAQLASVQSVAAVDEFTVDLQLASAAAAPTLASLGDRAGMMISPTAYAAAGSSAAFSQAPVGAGPYRIEGSWAPRESGSIRAADGYWDPTAQHLAGVDFTEFTQDQLNALRAGDMDVVALAPLDISVIEGDNAFNLVTGPTSTMRIFVMNETIAPFDNLLVRQAIAHAIDRETIADIQLMGLGEAAYQPVPSTNFAYDPTL
ncbi:MAG TPA: ABC transporter substrate-binding protein, partial [Ilumatobacter sp.]|nr:ABC transporter substrate-binding protein [Ilumatobacter sp.]